MVVAVSRLTNADSTSMEFKYQSETLASHSRINRFLIRLNHSFPPLSHVSLNFALLHPTAQQTERKRNASNLIKKVEQFRSFFAWFRLICHSKRNNFVFSQWTLNNIWGWYFSPSYPTHFAWRRILIFLSAVSRGLWIENSANQPWWVPASKIFHPTLPRPASIHTPTTTTIFTSNFRRSLCGRRSAASRAFIPIFTPFTISWNWSTTPVWANKFGSMYWPLKVCSAEEIVFNSVGIDVKCDGLMFPNGWHFLMSWCSFEYFPVAVEYRNSGCLTWGKCLMFVQQSCSLCFVHGRKPVFQVIALGLNLLSLWFCNSIKISI